MAKKYVRVFIEASQIEKSVPEEYAKAVGLKPLTDSKGNPKPASNKSGGPLPEKRRIDKGTGDPTPLPSVEQLQASQSNGSVPEPTDDDQLADVDQGPDQVESSTDEGEMDEPESDQDPNRP